MTEILPVAKGGTGSAVGPLALKPLTNAANLNEVFSPGCYQTGNPANAPFIPRVALVIVLTANTANAGNLVVLQLFVPTAATSTISYTETNIYCRHTEDNISSEWCPWRNINFS